MKQTILRPLPGHLTTLPITTHGKRGKLANFSLADAKFDRPQPIRPSNKFESLFLRGAAALLNESSDSLFPFISFPFLCDDLRFFAIRLRSHCDQPPTALHFRARAGEVGAEIPVVTLNL
ncbi:MAG: hypothetical protein EOO18_07615 [Chryseobacterium sp.]|nr:MAG: hypothetical protein EOO18_07615 [Chryseobacterium sp.]